MNNDKTEERVIKFVILESDVHAALDQLKNLNWNTFHRYVVLSKMHSGQAFQGAMKQIGIRTQWKRRPKRIVLEWNTEDVFQAEIIQAIQPWIQQIDSQK